MITTISCYLDLDEATARRLQKLLTRDTRIINRVLSVMRQEEQQIFEQKKSGKWYASRKILAELMLTTANRVKVPYDLKQQFPRISHNELMECIDTAKENYLAYLTNREQMTASPPSADYRRGYVPRSIGYRRFRLKLDPVTTTAVISVIDSYDSNLRLIKLQEKEQQSQSVKIKKIRHDYLGLNLRVGNYHFQQLQRYQKTIKAVKILCDQQVSRDNPHKFRVQLAIERNHKPVTDTNLPRAVIGIDLGISRLLTAIVLTRNGVIETRTFGNTQQQRDIQGIEERIAEIQQVIKYRKLSHYYSLLRKYGNRCISQSWQLGQYLLQLGKQLRQQSRGEDYTWIRKASDQLQEMQSQYNTGTRRILHRVIKLLQQLVDNWSDLDQTTVLYRKLKQLYSRRAALVNQQIKQSCAAATNWIRQLSRSYNLSVAVGDVSWIRKGKTRGKSGKWLRKHVHKWNYRKIYQQLQHNLAKLGLEQRFYLVREYWTSQLCHRCGKRGVRPQQWKFCCSNYTCGWQGNADVNGAINIALRLMKWKRLVSARELRSWRISPH